MDGQGLVAVLTVFSDMVAGHSFQLVAALPAQCDWTLGQVLSPDGLTCHCAPGLVQDAPGAQRGDCMHYSCLMS